MTIITEEEYDKVLNYEEIKIYYVQSKELML